MCSISGFFSNKPLKKETALRLASALLYYGQARGKQSAGASVIGPKGVKLAKRAMRPDKFIETPEFKQLFSGGAKVALLHTRFPTCGERTDKQAQPFTRPETLTVHNGYYFDITGIRDKWGLNKKSGVDSELVTDFIDSYGIDLLPDFLATTDGPNAIAAYHKGRLYLTRGGNPLHYCPINIDGCKLVVFASTFEQLEAAIRYAVLSDFPDIRELKQNKIYEVGVKQLRKISNWKTEIKKRTTKKAKNIASLDKWYPYGLDSLIDRHSVVLDENDDTYFNQTMAELGQLIDLEENEHQVLDLVEFIEEKPIDESDYFIDINDLE